MRTFHCVYLVTLQFSARYRKRQTDFVRWHHHQRRTAEAVTSEAVGNGDV